MFEYTAPKYRIDEAVYSNRIGSYTENGIGEFEAQLNALVDLQELYGFEIREVIWMDIEDREKDVDMEEVKKICAGKTAAELDAEFEKFKKEFAEKHKND